MSGRGIIIAAPRSGSGKTSVTIGLLRALRRRGVRVRGAKSGPDYIDPEFHAAATGAPGVNLDSWAMPPDLTDQLLRAQGAEADLVVVESAMGLFDGIATGDARTGAAADLARRYDLPVLLVLDISGQSQTAAVTAKGFATYDPAVRLAGIVLNQVASERHAAQARAPIEALGIPVLGVVKRDATMSLPERHLGLVQAREHSALDAHIDRLADIMESALDLDAILAAAAVPALPAPTGDLRSAVPPPGQRIAVADDAAFAFLYPHMVTGWRAMGAELVPFSPLADAPPDPSCDACWLPGGYPELHAGRLAAAEGFKAGLRAFAQTRPVHGECGGHMVLGRALEDAAGVMHPMVDLLDHVTSYAKRKINLGYRQARLRADCVLGPAGGRVRGHEFHYSVTLEVGRDAPLVDLADGLGKELGTGGGRRGHVTGTYFHAISREPA